MSGDLLSEPGDRTFVGAQQTSEAKEKGRFAGSGPADETDDLAAFDIEIHFAERGDRSGASTRTSQVRLGETSDAKRAHLTPSAVMTAEFRAGCVAERNR
jgi:hypothetical protein